MRARCTQIGPRHPRLGRAAFRCMLPLLECYYAHHRTYRLNSAFAAERLRAVRTELDRGATVYLAGISAGGHIIPGSRSWRPPVREEYGSPAITRRSDFRARSTRPSIRAMRSTLLSERPIVSVSDQTGSLHGSALGTMLHSVHNDPYLFRGASRIARFVASRLHYLIQFAPQHRGSLGCSYAWPAAWCQWTCADHRDAPSRESCVVFLHCLTVCPQQDPGHDCRSRWDG